MSEEAKEIYQRVIDVLSDALMEGDFSKFGPYFTLPHVMQTLSGTLRMEDEDELRRSFEGFSASLKAHRATHYIRLTDQAEFETPDRIVGEHTSHILRNAIYLAPAYPNRLVLDRVDGVWKVGNALNAIGNTTWPVLLPKVPTNPKLPEQKDTISDEDP